MGTNEKLHKILLKLIIFIEENFELPVNLISMLLYNGGLLCMECIGIFLEKLLVCKISKVKLGKGPILIQTILLMRKMFLF